MCSVQPEGELGDFDGFLVDIDAVEVVFENLVVDVLEHQRMPVDMGSVGVYEVMLGFEER